MSAKHKTVKRPRVIPNCVASHYQHPHERIVEFSFPGVDGLPGGLMSLFHTLEGQLMVNLYQLVGPLIINVSGNGEYDVSLVTDECGKHHFEMVKKEVNG